MQSQFPDPSNQQPKISFVITQTVSSHPSRPNGTRRPSHVTHGVPPPRPPPARHAGWGGDGGVTLACYVTTHEVATTHLLKPLGACSCPALHPKDACKCSPGASDPPSPCRRPHRGCGARPTTAWKICRSGPVKRNLGVAFPLPSPSARPEPHGARLLHVGLEPRVLAALCCCATVQNAIRIPTARSGSKGLLPLQ